MSFSKYLINRSTQNAFKINSINSTKKTPNKIPIPTTKEIEFWYNFKKIQQITAHEYHVDLKQYCPDRKDLLLFIKDHTKIPIEVLKDIILRQPHLIRFIKNPSRELLLFTAQYNIYTLKHMDIDLNKDLDFFKQISKNKYAITLVKRQTKEICEIAIKGHGESIRFIKNQTPELCRKAVLKNRYALQHVKKSLKTPELCLLAVRHNGLTLEWVDEQTEEMCLCAIQKNKLAFSHVKNQTLKICKLAVERNGFNIQFIQPHIKEQAKEYEELCKLAIEKNPKSIAFIENPTYEMCLNAIVEDPAMIYFIDIKKYPDVYAAWKLVNA